MADHRLRRLTQWGTRCQVVTEKGIQIKEQKRAGSAGVEERNGQPGTERDCTSTIHVELEKPERWLGWLHDRGAAIAVNRLACRCSWPVENVHCAPVSSSWGMKGRSCMKTDSLVIFPRVADDWLEGLPPSENELACMFSLKSLVSD